MIMVSQGILVELNIILLQQGVLVFRVPNWFCGHWYRVHHEGVCRVRVAQSSFEVSGFGFKG
jgi:hypothetical protein